jgi:hypothetical protein
MQVACVVKSGFVWSNPASGNLAAFLKGLGFVTSVDRGGKVFRAHYVNCSTFMFLNFVPTAYRLLLAVLLLRASPRPSLYPFGSVISFWVSRLYVFAGLECAGADAYPTLLAALEDPTYVFAPPSDGSEGKRPELIGTRVATSLKGLTFKKTNATPLNFLADRHLASVVYAAQCRYLETVADDFKDLAPINEHFVPYYMKPGTLSGLIAKESILAERMLDTTDADPIEWVT